MMLVSTETRPQVWAGLECTCNRVGDVYFDQLSQTGHDQRPDDLARLKALGVQAIRYPVLWERTESPDGHRNWSWADQRLGLLRELELPPIVGLVHHGSGPPSTSLVDPSFPERLAEYAGQVARRFPWVQPYTPVNEPLTTARFAGLYGHWYPHGRDSATFARALINQCRGVLLAMRAIREVRPDAILVQTDDLGQTHAAPSLQYQADFENERRWLSYDLLCGRVDERHPMWSYLRESGVSELALKEFRESPCPPGIIGINHYLTSERYLDPRLHAYAAHQLGSNGRDQYADVEAVRVLQGGPVGIGELLKQAWTRYGLPIAITEAHLGCTREEQLRWLAEVWQSACKVRREGVNLLAVTAWTAFGSFGWDTLVTRDSGTYESGLFDVRSDPPRTTAVAALVHELASGQEPSHPVLHTPGWWRRPGRLYESHGYEISSPVSITAPRLLITGASSPLGQAFARICEARGLPSMALSRLDVDIANRDSVARALDTFKPWAVVNAAGFHRVNRAEIERERCRRQNSEGAALLAEGCAQRQIALLTFSSDLVFDGRAQRPYVEEDGVAPLNEFGLSKMEAERLVLEQHPRTLVVRTSAYFGPWDHKNFVSRCLASLRDARSFDAAEDIVLTPTYLPDLVHACLDLLVDGASGLWHLSNPDAMTFADLARDVAMRAGFAASAIRGRPSTHLGWRAVRPAYTALGTSRGYHLPPLSDGLNRYFRESPEGRVA